MANNPIDKMMGTGDSGISELLEMLQGAEDAVKKVSERTKKEIEGGRKQLSDLWKEEKDIEEHITKLAKERQ